MEIIIAGIGGILGSIARFSTGNLISKKFKGIFPVGTFIINISGAFLLGILSTLHTEKNIYVFLADGFLGAYTTFSTFMSENFSLFEAGKRKNAALYIILSLILGISGFILGTKLLK